MASFGIELADLIQKHYPLATKGDQDQLAKASSLIAVTFGGLIALACRLQSESSARMIVEAICRQMLKHATNIDAKAMDILRDPRSN